MKVFPGVPGVAIAVPRRPWEHYLPLRMDLADLSQRLRWLDAHPEEAERIAETAARWAREFLSHLVDPGAGDHFTAKAGAMACYGYRPYMALLYMKYGIIPYNTGDFSKKWYIYIYTCNYAHTCIYV